MMKYVSCVSPPLSPQCSDLPSAERSYVSADFTVAKANIYIYNAEVLMAATNNHCLRWKWKQLQLQQHSNPLQSHEAAGPIISNLGLSLLRQNLLQHLVNKTLLIHRHIEAMYVINGYHSGQVSLLLKREINLAPPSKSKGAAVDFTVRRVLTDAHM